MEKHSFCVYMHNNKINNKKYIGQSCNIKERWGSNGAHYQSCPHFWNAIQKYGWDNFEHIILKQDLTSDEANDYEKYYIQKYNTINPDYGYNIVNSGQNGELPYISEYLKEKWKDPEYRKKMTELNSGKNSHFYGSSRIGEQNPMWGKKHSEETKKKISEKAKERYKNNPDAVKGKNNPMAKQVICLTTGQVFECRKDAAKWAGVGTTTMSRWLHKQTKTTGTHPETGEPLDLDYYNKEGDEK
jgi:group I intron endonuclease